MSWKRSVVKAFSWKIISMVVVLALTGDISLSLLYLILTWVLFIVHDRVWKLIKYEK